MMKMNLERRKEMKQMKIPSPSRTVVHQVTQGEGMALVDPRKEGALLAILMTTLGGR